MVQQNYFQICNYKIFKYFNKIALSIYNDNQCIFLQRLYEDSCANPYKKTLRDDTPVTLH